MLTVKKTAIRSGVSPGLVYHWIQSGRLPHLRLGKTGTRGVIRIDEADLEAFLQSLKQASGALPPTPKPAKKRATFRHLTIR